MRLITIYHRKRDKYGVLAIMTITLIGGSLSLISKILTNPGYIVNNSTALVFGIGYIAGFYLAYVILTRLFREIHISDGSITVYNIGSSQAFDICDAVSVTIGKGMIVLKLKNKRIEMFAPLEEREKIEENLREIFETYSIPVEGTFVESA